MRSRFATLKSLRLKDLNYFVKYKTNEKKILTLFLLIAVLFFLVGIVFREDPLESFRRTAEKFAIATTKYNPEDAEKYTDGPARSLVKSQAVEVAQTRANGLKTELQGKVETEILNQRENQIIAKVTVNTKESWPGEAAEDYVHIFSLEGLRSGHTWKIYNILEIEVKKLPQASGGTNDT